MDRHDLGVLLTYPTLIQELLDLTSGSIVVACSLVGSTWGSFDSFGGNIFKVANFGLQQNS